MEIMKGKVLHDVGVFDLIYTWKLGWQSYIGQVCEKTHMPDQHGSTDKHQI